MLQKLSASPLAVWPSDGEATDLQTVVWAQMAVVHDQAVVLDGYQGVLDNAQAVPPATATGNSTGTAVLTLTSVVGKVKLGAVVTGTGVPAGTAIVAQTAGTAGGNGTYTTNVATTLGNIALTLTPGGGNSPWPPATDAPDLLLISQLQTSIMRTQNSLMAQYVDLLNASSTAPPP
jgi:hypothetical protein